MWCDYHNQIIDEITLYNRLKLVLNLNLKYLTICQQTNTYVGN